MCLINLAAGIIPCRQVVEGDGAVQFSKVDFFTFS